MYRRLACIIWVVVAAAACVTLHPHDDIALLAIEHDQGGAWPRVASMKVYADGALEHTNGRVTVRARVDSSSERFRRLLASLEAASFSESLRAASEPPLHAGGSGERIRLDYKGTVVLVEPPATSATCEVLNTVDVLFEATFARRYRRRFLHVCAAATRVPEK